MCGIAGFFHGQSAELLNPIITQMCDRIYHSRHISFIGKF